MNDETIQICTPETEMNYLLDSCSDAGISGKRNQDACCARILRTPNHTIVLAVVCDGAGGMSEGEFASNSTINVINDWFDYKINKMVLEGGQTDLFQILCEDFKQLIQEQNKAIFAYGKKRGIRVGTTLTALLFVNQDYFIAQIGDSRAYLMKEELMQLTEDQSLVMKEVKEGRLTEEKAKYDKRRNIILQCLGVTAGIEPVYQYGTVQKESSYFICSDGLVHELEKEELSLWMNPNNISSISEAHNCLSKAVNTVKERGEKDNITVVLVRTL